MNMNPQGSQHEDRSQGQTGNAVGPERRLLVVEDEFFLAVQIEEWLLENGLDVVDERGEKARPFTWLRKPFTAEALLGAVQSAFDSLAR